MPTPPAAPARGVRLRHVMTVPPNVKYQDLFLKLQREARGLGGGRWALSFYLLKILVFTRSASNLWFFSCGTSYTR